MRFTRPGSYLFEVNPKFVANKNLNRTIVSLLDLYFASLEIFSSPVARFITPTALEDKTFSSISRHDTNSLSSQSPNANLPPNFEESTLDIRLASNKLSRNCPKSIDFPELDALPATINFLHLLGSNNIPNAQRIICMDSLSLPVASSNNLSKYGVSSSEESFFKYFALIS